MVDNVIVNKEGKPALLLSNEEAQALDNIAKKYSIKEDHKNALGWAIIHMRDLVALAKREGDEGTADYYMLHLPEMLEMFLENTDGGNKSS